MTERNPTVVVTSDETLADVVVRLRGAASGGRTVHLVVPIDSPLLLTANEFRTLKDAIDEHRLPVQMRTADPLRLQLAERLGVPAKTLPRARRTVAPAAPPSPPSPPEPPPDPARAAPEAEPFIGPSLQPDPASHWPDQNGASDAAAADVNGETPESAPGREPLLAPPPRRWLPVALVLALIVVAALFALRFAVPRAVIRIVPKTAPVAGSLVFDVTADGQPRDADAAFALAPTPREVEVVWTGDMPVTGVRLVPDGVASGPIELRNASAEPLTVDAGTAVSTESGVEFAFTEAVAVPAADAATGEPGAATGSVQAVQAGSTGNAGTGEIGGRLPNGVYYSNRMQPAAGGTDKAFPVVAQADLDALSARAASGAGELATDALAKSNEGDAVLASSVTIEKQQDVFDHQVDEEVDRVALRATMLVQTMTYDAAAATASFEPALARQLAAAAPAGFVVAPESLVFAPPAEVEHDARGARLEVTASGQAEAVLDDAERQELAEALSGKSPEEAAAILATSPEIASFTVAYEPGWLAKQMPNNAGRINFEVGQ